MLEGKKIVVVMPAYNAEKTLLRTYKDIPIGVVDEILVTDDGSTDQTVRVAKDIACLYMYTNITRAMARTKRHVMRKPLEEKQT